MKNRKHIHRRFGVRIGPTDGKEVVGTARRVFSHNIDKGFFREGLSWPGEPTPAKNFVVFEVDDEFKRGTTASDVFASTGIALDHLVAEESEIVEFGRRFPEELRNPDTGVFLLLKKGKEIREDSSNLFVVGVFSEHDGLAATLWPFWHPSGWSPDLRVFIIVPH